jgi:hypothetical protein
MSIDKSRKQNTKHRVLRRSKQEKVAAMEERMLNSNEVYDTISKVLQAEACPIFLG